MERDGEKKIINYIIRCDKEYDEAYLLLLV